MDATKTDSSTRRPLPETLIAKTVRETRVRLDAASEFLALRDANLAGVIRRIGRCEMSFRVLHNPFNTLARSIIYQQLNGKAAGAIHRRVIERLAPDGVLTARVMLDTPEESLRGCGLSGAKTTALRDLAKHSLDGTVPTLRELARLDEEEIIERLTVVRGIGRWTVEMLLMFRLGRPDVLPVDDFAIRKAVMLLDGLAEMPKPKIVFARGEVWKPYRTVASWYLWRSLDQPAESVAKRT